MNPLPKATHQGKLPIVGFPINCAVVIIDNEPVRVLVERSVANAFGIRGSGAYWQSKKRGDLSSMLPEYVSAKYLEPFVSKELREKLSNHIEYLTLNGKIARGLEATVLPDVCDVWIRAKEASALPKTQEKIAENAYILMKGFANVGIIALVDEATNFQEIRDRLALQKILDKFLLKEYAKWAKRFPDEFYQKMFELKGWQWKGMKINRPSVVGTYTNDIIYSRLAPGILAELKRLNPPDDRGQRKLKHHQWFTEDIGHPALQQHLAILIAFMRAAPNWGAFHRLVERAFPKFGDTIPLALEEE
ncbi:MAG: P63C domain-containing protein [Ignavibacteriales bacterium]|nr:P63C domain-containing protein [Ignavibacteriales bacterium]